MAGLKLTGVKKAYGDVQTLHGIDLTIEDGEFVVFVGPSGCGKSTLLRSICGLEEISAGDFTIGGKRMNDVPPAERGISMVFQSYALYPHMSVFENMAFGLKLAGINKHDQRDAVMRAARVLRSLNLPGVGGAPATSWQVQRCQDGSSKWYAINAPTGRACLLLNATGLLSLEEFVPAGNTTA